ncbi:hypothetical protein [Methanosarcina vacuolata]|uniref:hypothetical protein n=1 Tax=Methanosarcina vacuolata TaxID=2215 RepID=UPI00064EF709|nr:hypothetical protein [Methanosarcina vacuolata]
MDDDSVEKWQQADEEIRKNLLPGVKIVRTLREHKNIIGRTAWSQAVFSFCSLADEIFLADKYCLKCFYLLPKRDKYTSNQDEMRTNQCQLN